MTEKLATIFGIIFYGAIAGAVAWAVISSIKLNKKKVNGKR